MFGHVLSLFVVYFKSVIADKFVIAMLNESLTWGHLSYIMIYLITCRTITMSLLDKGGKYGRVGVSFYFTNCSVLGILTVEILLFYKE